MPFETPIALIIFNRPEKTKRVLQAISVIKPSKLFVIADGPRSDRPDDFEKVIATRGIVDNIDWDCEINKNYTDENLGCGLRPATGISWVFDNVEEAIIIEDDCVPDPSFFPFCEELLQKYKNDERVMQISGFNSMHGNHTFPYSYHFYRLFSCWGWATWRRAWSHFDMKMTIWPLLRDTTFLYDILGDERAVQYFRRIYDEAHANSDNIHYWDYQYLFACWAQNGLAISPNVNLVSNIGYDSEATHDTNPFAMTAHVPVGKMEFPINHPPYIARELKADQYHLSGIMASQNPRRKKGFLERLSNKLSIRNKLSGYIK